MTTKHSNAAFTRQMVAACAAFLAAIIPAWAQSTTHQRRHANKDQVVNLSKFEVITTQDKGYVANNTATGFQDERRIDQDSAVGDGRYPGFDR